MITSSKSMGAEQLTEFCSSPSISPSLTPPLCESDVEELDRMPLFPPQMKPKKWLSKQLSMCETPRDIAWEKRRRQMLMQDRRRNRLHRQNSDHDLTDEDLHELKGSIELGFGFKEEQGQKLCNTLPALDLYFAVNRQLSPMSSPGGSSTSSLPGIGGLNSPFDSFKSDSDSLKIISAGDDPQQVKTRLRHWAQAVACSVMQSS